MGVGGSSNYDPNQKDQICIFSQKRFSNQIKVDWSFDTIFNAIGIFLATEYDSGFLLLSNFYLLLIPLANSLDPDQVHRTSVLIWIHTTNQIKVDWSYDTIFNAIGIFFLK